jgi:CheY-like chemotaxis protein
MNKLSGVLLVDDDKIINFLNRWLLQDLQVARQVLVAENGQEALGLIYPHGEGGYYPDLILLDINMPVMNGFEFLEAYAALDFAGKQTVVIVMLTTSLNPRDVNRLQLLPMQGFLSKPLTRQKVQDLLKQHFN